MDVSTEKAPANLTTFPKSVQKKRKRKRKAHKSRTGDGNTPSELKGLKKWLWEYYAKRPGTSVLQKQVDAFIADYETREEQARKEREKAAAKDEGWTLVVNKGGRKKVTDPESGVKVGGVAALRAEKQSEKKKGNEQGILNFYRFQRREVRRNEILELQQRFEEDKKRIAKMRAARKFRPF